MALNARNYKQESNFERPDPLEPGTYPARVIQIISRGLQAQDPYMGQEKPPKHELQVTYELLDEFLLDEDGEEIKDKPRWIHERFTMNALESDLAKSTKRYLALDPKMVFDGDWSKLIGAPCMVTIVTNEKNDKVYNNVASVQTMRPKEAAQAPDLVNDPKVFDVDDPDIEVFLSLPQWLQDDIKGNLEFGGSILEKKLKEHSGEEKPAKAEKKAAKKVNESDEELSEDDEEEDW